MLDFKMIETRILFLLIIALLSTWAPNAQGINYMCIYYLNYNLHVSKFF